MKKNSRRILFISTVITSSIYIVWRLFFTLPFQYGVIPVLFGILLLGAELIGFLESVNIYRGMVDMYEPEKPKVSLEDYPDVDIFIATYNEPAELLKKTVKGCQNMDYPDKSKVHIYICDDGHRESMMELAENMNVTCIHRKDHSHAKAGNYNHALSCTSSPLIATFDADMIPRHNFLMELVPYFLSGQKEGEKIGFVQSPQSFYNADLFQYNLYSEDIVPNEQDFFFRQVQLSRNSSNSAIYGGSNTILLREALKEAGGFYTESITEDLATGLLIQAKGYKGYAVHKVLASGLSPTETDSLFKQRERWARGCIQTLRKIKIFRNKDLTWRQKRDYLFSAVYWYMPLRRFAFIAAPILYTVFGIPVLDCTMAGLLIFWLPQVVLYNISLSILTGEIRTARLSNIYDTILFPYLLPKILCETFGSSQKKFVVTKKEKKVEEKQVLAKRSERILKILVVLSIIGIIRCMFLTMDDEAMGTQIVFFWLLVNLYNIVMAVFFLKGRRVHRADERISIQENVVIHTKQAHYQGKTTDISEGGVSICMDFPYYISEEEIVSIELGENGRYSCSIPAKVVHVKQVKEGWHYGFSFEEMKEETYDALLGVLYDRVPPTPKKVSHKSGFYSDFQNNFQNRRRKQEFSNRKLARVELDLEAYSKEAGMIRICNFNYEYVLLELDWDYERLTVLVNEKITFVCVKSERMDGIYRIENLEEVLENPYFHSSMVQWMNEYEKKQQERYRELHTREKDGEDELLEMPFITDGIGDME